MTAAASVCTRCQTVLEDGDLRCPICALPVPPAPGGPVDGGGRAQLLRCKECGAAIAFSAEAQAPRCGFCGATMVIEQPVDPVEVAELRLPFVVGHDAAVSALRHWLGKRGWFAPRTLSSEAVLESLTPLSWAAWVVNAQAMVAWTADSDMGAGRASWAPHAGGNALGFRNIIVSASRGLRDREVQHLIPYYDVTTAVAIDDGGGAPDAAPESRVERFDTQRSAARKQVRDSIEALARNAIEPEIPGVRYRNVHIACMLERQTTQRIALPAWILAYRYRGDPYRAIVHGQRSDVVFGKSPVDWAKVGWLVAIIAAVIAIIALIIIIAVR